MLCFFALQVASPRFALDSAFCFYNHLTLHFLCTVIFSPFTGQSYVVFHQIWKARQTGHVTRIVSGCANASKERIMESIFDQQIRNGIPTGRNRFHLHITQDYSNIVPNVEYNPFNKPFGVLHWMEHALKMPSTLPQYSNTMFIIIDPDQIILRPFVSHDFSMAFYPSQWHNKEAEAEELRNLVHVVKEGHPIAQFYAMGSHFIDPINRKVQLVMDAAWKATKDNPAFTPEMKSSTALYNWSKVDVLRSYVAGPPYIATALNLYQITVVWAAISVPIFELTTDAAHLALRHDLTHNFVVGYVGSIRVEAWEEHIDEMPVDDLCKHTTTDLNKPSNVDYTSKLPFVLHYWSQYFHGKYHFRKYGVSKHFLSCEHPLLADPSEFDAQVRAHSKENNATTLYLASAFNSTLAEIYQKRNVFMLCHLIGRINDAATYWKQANCLEGVVNYSMVYSTKH